MERYEKKKNPTLGVLITLGIMSVCTAILLLILALLMYQMNLSTKAASVGIILIYIIVGFLGGFLMGKQMRERRFLWGLAVGALYFFLLLVISLALGGGKIEDLGQMFLSMILCIASSMVGGMLS